jgi:hypothetical protein
MFASAAVVLSVPSRSVQTSDHYDTLDVVTLRNMALTFARSILLQAAYDRANCSVLRSSAERRPNRAPSDELFLGILGLRSKLSTKTDTTAPTACAISTIHKTLIRETIKVFLT